MRERVSLWLVQRTLTLSFSSTTATVPEPKTSLTELTHQAGPIHRWDGPLLSFSAPGILGSNEAELLNGADMEICRVSYTPPFPHFRAHTKYRYRFTILEQAECSIWRDNAKQDYQGQRPKCSI